MIRNYLVVAIRHLIRHKWYTLINVAGLSIGMACTILILLWIQDELSYDRYHEKAHRIFRVIDYEQYSNGDELTFSTNPPALAVVLEERYPEIEQAVRLRKMRDVIVSSENRRFSESEVLLADPEYLQVFTHPMIIGEASTALQQPNNIVLTASTAEKYFGHLAVIDEVLTINNTHDFIVSGVIHDVPTNSHFSFDFIIPFQAGVNFNMPLEGWDSYALTTFVLLNDAEAAPDLNLKIADLIPEFQEEAIVELSLQPLTDIHLYSGTMWGMGGDGDIRIVIMFSIVAGFILFMACINFMNLATARAGNRAREVGIRKVVGSSRQALIRQFYFESLLLTGFALLIAIILVESALSVFNNFTGKTIALNLFQEPDIFLVLLGTALLTGFISGSYPALFLASFPPIVMLKGTVAAGSKGALFRKVLVTAQYILTISLIIGTLVVGKQLRFVQNQKLGYNQKQVLYLELKGDLRKNYDLLTMELARQPGVISASTTSYLPSSIGRSAILSEWEGRQGDDQFLTHLLSTDHDFAATLELEMQEGRYFSREFASDTSNGIIVNETAVRNMGMINPIGKTIFSGQIIGVVKDFNFESLHSKIGPLAIYCAPQEFQYILLQLQPDDLTDIIAGLKTRWNELVPDIPFDYGFLDARIANQYNLDRQVENIINSFTALALIVAGLGLFGLVSFMAERRTKEFGIRKVLGASMPGLVHLMSREFIRCILWANLIAWPVAWLAMNGWLSGYAYRIRLDWWLFPLAGFIALVIAQFSVAFHAIRTAYRNPVKSLRYE